MPNFNGMMNIINAVIEDYSAEEREMIAAMLLDSVAAEREVSVNEVYDEIRVIADAIEKEMGPLGLD